MDEIVIRVSLDQSNEGYSFSIYDGNDCDIECEEIDGGLCTSTMQNALDMAVDQAKEILRRGR